MFYLIPNFKNTNLLTYRLGDSLVFTLVTTTHSNDYNSNYYNIPVLEL
jgi:hypothetical protein